MEMIICMSEPTDTTYTVPGTIESECLDCGIKVYISPSGQLLMSTSHVVCVQCGAKRLEEEEEERAELA